MGTLLGPVSNNKGPNSLKMHVITLLLETTQSVLNISQVNYSLGSEIQNQYWLLKSIWYNFNFKIDIINLTCENNKLCT